MAYNEKLFKRIRTKGAWKCTGCKDLNTEELLYSQMRGKGVVGVTPSTHSEEQQATAYVLKKPLTKEAELAKNWLLNSGIQQKDGEHKGVFNCWYDQKEKHYEYAYSEVTGYGISTLLYLYKLTNDETMLEQAKLAGDWVMKKAHHRSGGVLTRHFYKEAKFMGCFTKEEIFAFDCGIVLNGMINLYKATGEKNYLSFSQGLGGFILNKLQKDDGSFYAVYDAKNEKLVDDGEKWSTQSGAYHAKLVIGLLALYDETKDSKYLDSVKKACDYSLIHLNEDGRFVTFSKTGATHFHPHCYGAEGLYCAGKYLHNDQYLKASERATAYLFNNQLPNGGIPYLFNGQFEEVERADILGQALRLGALHGMDKKKLEKLKNRLLEFQVKEGPQSGGFVYGHDETGKHEHVNSWCTMFALQALTTLDNPQSLHDNHLLLV